MEHGLKHFSSGSTPHILVISWMGKLAPVEPSGHDFRCGHKNNRFNGKATWSCQSRLWPGKSPNVRRMGVWKEGRFFMRSCQTSEQNSKMSVTWLFQGSNKTGFKRPTTRVPPWFCSQKKSVAISTFKRPTLISFKTEATGLTSLSLSPVTTTLPTMHVCTINMTSNLQWRPAMLRFFQGCKPSQQSWSSIWGSQGSGEYVAWTIFI